MTIWVIAIIQVIKSNTLKCTKTFGNGIINLQNY